MKIQILKSKNAQFYWRIVARNGRILATSETYKSKQSCLHTAEKVLDTISSTVIDLQDLTKKP